jgi:Asp-tRNA(Asn)/Glu-tRNA(Gln) amidotransferase A subunit family amidase
MDPQSLCELTATEAARLIREGAITSQELVDACLTRIREREEDVQAWSFLDPDHAMDQAHAADEWRLSGRPTGPLHGVPIGVKDIIDTGDMPTEQGSVLYAGRTPSRDAAVVARLRAAGAVILGKTVTTEFATYTPGKTRNPHNPAHTPGGSSSGSAAAVAAGMVPLAVGSQTNGSVIRPAAFCGVYGFKPTRGLVPRTGVLRTSRSLDQLGVFARDIPDLALIAEQITGFDEGDPDTRPAARIPFTAVAAEEPPLPPMFAFVKTPYWERAEGETREAFAELAAHLGQQTEELDLSASAAEAWDWHRTIMEAEMAHCLRREFAHGRDRLSEPLQAQLARGRLVSALDYQAALARVDPLHDGLVELFEQRYDAIVTPAAPGTAPKGLDSTGDPVFCTLWTLCGMPAITVPLMQGSEGLPLGIQLVGPRHGDARLLRTARWLVESVRRG